MHGHRCATMPVMHIWRDVSVATGVVRRTLLDSALLRIVRWRCCAPQQTAELRTPWYVVSFTHVGSFMVHTHGQGEMIDATRAMLIRPGEPFRMTRCSSAVASGLAVSIHPDVVHRLAPRISDAVARADVPGGAFLLQHLLLRRISEGRDPDLEEVALRVAAQTFLAPERENRRPSRSKGQSAISDVQALLAAKFTERVRLDEVARTVDLSLYHLCRTFKRETGLPMHHYLNRLRVRASVVNVVDSKTNLSVLAHLLGYSSHSHFSEAFRNEFRITPTEVRRIAALPRLAEMRRALERLE